MGIHHLKLCFVGIGQLFPPVSNAFLLGQSNHPHEDRCACIPQNQNPAGGLILIDHIVNGFDQCRHIKQIDIAKGFLKGIDEFILNALHQGKAIAVMGIEGGTVKLRQRANLFHRNSVYRFFLQQLQKRLLEHHLRIAFPCVHFLHIELLQKSLQRKATLQRTMLLFFQSYGKC